MGTVIAGTGISVMAVIVMLGILVMSVRKVIFTDLNIINIKS
jgi:hypothetical protein